MTEPTVEISRSTLKNILAMYADATDLLQQIPKMQDQGRLSEVSQHIGAELEARITEMNEAEKQDYIITELLDEISSDQVKRKKEEEPSLEDLEDDILGDE